MRGNDMAKFKKGDRVLRLSAYTGFVGWINRCAEVGLPVTSVFTVSAALPYGDLLLEEMPQATGGWTAVNFRLATDAEIIHGYALPVEDHIAEKDAHVECLREKIAELERDLDTTRKQLDVVMKANNRLSDDIAAANDQRDAAVLAAKSLGDEVQCQRHTARIQRMNLKQHIGFMDALEAGVIDVDLDHLISQLRLIAEMADEQGNGADAKLCADAALVVDMVQYTLDLHRKFTEDEE
jgi:hypothetical protein